MKIAEILTKSPEFHAPSEKPFTRMSPESIGYRDRLNEMIGTGKIAFEEVPLSMWRRYFFTYCKIRQVRHPTRHSYLYYLRPSTEQPPND